jgi:hypothetical protein
MALAQIIDLEERRRSRQVPAASLAPTAGVTPVWYYVWMPVYFWYVP